MKYVLVAIWFFFSPRRWCIFKYYRKRGFDMAFRYAWNNIENVGDCDNRFRML